MVYFFRLSMANNPGDIPTVVDECSKLKLNVNLKTKSKVLKDDLHNSDNFSWLPLLADELGKFREECSKLELNVNNKKKKVKKTKVLKHDSQCSNNFSSWLPLLTDELGKYSDITTLNPHDKIRLLEEVQKYLPKILKLHDDLQNAVASTYNFTPKPQGYDSKPIKIEKTVNEEKTNPADVIQKRYYPPAIVNYVRALDACDVSTVRLRSNEVIECLLCPDKNKYRNMSNIGLHICTKKHLQRLTDDRYNLLMFHNFWQRQTSKIWENHLQFDYASDCLRCIVCRKRVKYIDVAYHLVTCSEAAVRQNSIFADINRSEYSGQTDIYRDIAPMKIGDVFYPTFQSLNGTALICLVCNEYMKLNQRDSHIDSKNHTRRQDEQTVQLSLVRYHKTWIVLPAELQFRQTHFGRGFNKMKCMICPDTFVDYDSECLYEHLTSVVHPSWSELQIALREIWRNPSDPTAGGSTNRNKKEKRTITIAKKSKKEKRRIKKAQKAQKSSAATTSGVLLQEPADLLPQSDNTKTGLKESRYVPPHLRIKRKPGTTEPTVNCVKEKIPPNSVHYDGSTNAPKAWELSSAIIRELLQKPANLLPKSDNNKADLNETEPTVDRVKENQNRKKKTLPDYVYFDCNKPGFISVTDILNSPTETSELNLNPTMLKTAPSCSNTYTNVADGVHHEKK